MQDLHEDKTVNKLICLVLFNDTETKHEDAIGEEPPTKKDTDTRIKSPKPVKVNKRTKSVNIPPPQKK